MKKRILRTITSFYLHSRDFNGITALELSQKLKKEWKDLIEPIKQLIEEDIVGIQHTDFNPNPHINRLGFPDKEIQVSKLETEETYWLCLYPLPKHLQSVVDTSKYDKKPYELCMALGESQLAYKVFDLSVLEFYRNDPRYFYNNDDIRGSISLSDEYYETSQIQESDQILLQTFGFAYDQELNRATAVFLRYLADLSPEHQQIWKAKELKGDYKLHPDYYRNTIIGDWGKKSPIFTAFIIELFVINQMTQAIGRPQLFNKDFGKYGEDRPTKFSFLVRPTLEEFNNFVLLLDKLLSDNINKKFFMNEVSYENETERSDGKIVIQQKGTIQILDEWMKKYFQFVDPKPWDESISAMKEVRRLRQKPAHAINENVFDQKYFKQQREIIIKAYGAIRDIRLIFANHPKVKQANIEVPDWLFKGKIWTY